MDTATRKTSNVSWWALLLAAEAILLALGTGIVLDASGTSLADATVAQGVMLAAALIFVASSATVLVTWLGADERGVTVAEAARTWWTVPVVIAAEALLAAVAAGVVWDYNTAAPMLDPTALQTVMLAGALIFFSAFVICLTGVLRADERAQA